MSQNKQAKDKKLGGYKKGWVWEELEEECDLNTLYKNSQLTNKKRAKKNPSAVPTVPSLILFILKTVLGAAEKPLHTYLFKSREKFQSDRQPWAPAVASPTHKNGYEPPEC